MSTVSTPQPGVANPPGAARRLLAWVEGRPGAALGLILLLGLALGAERLVSHPPDPGFNWDNRWWQIAVDVARGNGYVSCKPIYFPFCGPENQVTAMREPLPVALFALLARVTGESLMAAAVVVLLVNLATAVAVFFLARELAGTGTGLLAALLWVSYLGPVHLLYGQPSGDLFAALALTLALYFLVRAREGSSARDWVSAGLWTGVALLSRSAGLVIALGLTAGLIVWPRGDDATRTGPPLRRLRGPVLFALCWMALALPWAVRNYVAFGRPVIGSTLSGYYLYRQNHMLGGNDYLRFVSGGEFVPVLREMLTRRPDLRGTENEAEMDRVYRDEALQVIRAEPRRYLELSAYRALILWFNRGVKEAYGQRASLGDRLIVLQHMLLLAAGVLGLRAFWRRAWPLAASLAALSVLHMAVMAHVTYVVSVVPLLVALAALGVTDLARRVWAGRASCARALALLAFGALGASDLQAQADSARPHVLEEQVVVAHRAPSMLRESVGATAVLDRPALERLPARTLADALRYLPGLTFLDRDGAGELPMAIARGFFGGGETDYVLVTVDGVPVNDLRSGLVEWTGIPLADVERIEVLRGGASVAYGDAAFGAVVHVTTRAAGAAHRLASGLRLGGWNERAFETSGRVSLGPGRLGLDGGASRIDGYRRHAAAEREGITAAYRTAADRGTAMYVRAAAQRLRNEEPGPITAAQLAEDPRASNPLFAADGRRREVLELGTGAARELGGGRLAADLRVRLSDDEQTRTLPLTTDQGDSQFHDARSRDLWARAQYTLRAGRATLVAGVEAERGTYESSYADPADHARVNSRGEGERTKLGQYAEWRQELGAGLRTVAGLRFDLVNLDGTGAETPARFRLWSPRVGVNYGYAASAAHTGNLYAAWTRAFKAPAPYQLYDVRLIPTGEPGGFVNLANPGLRPQHSSGLEAGLYHTLALWGASAVAEISLSAYRMDVDDEIDFDLETFRFGNILESRHDGVEGAVLARLTPWLALRQAVTLSRVVFRSGKYEGNRLKNLPSTALASAVELSPSGALDATVTHRYTGRIYLDDANLEPVPGSHVFDVTAAWTAGRLRLRVAGLNLGNSRAPTGGFLTYDVGQDRDVPLLYPRGGRTWLAGLSVLY